MARIADYTFDDSAGTARDGGGPTAEDGTYHGDAAAQGDGTASFDGNGDYAVIAPSPEFALNQGTIIMEFTQDTRSVGDVPWGDNAAQTLFSVDSQGYDGGGHLTIYITSTGRIGVRHQTATQEHFFEGGTITLGQPASFGYSFGPSGSTLVVNGQVVATGSAPLVLAGGVEPIVIGATQTHSGDGVANNLKGFFDGSVSRLQIHDTPIATSAPLPCFVTGTRIATPRGPVAVESLVEGDLVLTRDAGAQPVCRIARRRVGWADLSAQVGLRPVVLRAGAFGNARDLWLSRQHAVLAGTPAGECLIRAVHLARFFPKLARIAHGRRQVDYVHLLLRDHHILLAEGAACESLDPSGTLARTLIPALAEGAPLAPCRPVLPAREVRLMAQQGAVPMAAAGCSQIAIA